MHYLHIITFNDIFIKIMKKRNIYCDEEMSITIL